MRDPVQCASVLLGNPAFKDVCKYASERVYEKDKSGVEHQVYTEMWSAEWWREVEVVYAVRTRRTIADTAPSIAPPAQGIHRFTDHPLDRQDATHHVRWGEASMAGLHDDRQHIQGNTTGCRLQCLDPYWVSSRRKPIFVQGRITCGCIGKPVPLLHGPNPCSAQGGRQVRGDDGLCRRIRASLFPDTCCLRCRQSRAVLNRLLQDKPLLSVQDPSRPTRRPYPRRAA